MKMLLALLAFILACAASAAEFVNLTFDQPDLRRLRTNALTGFVSGPVRDLLRGWEVSIRAPLGEWSLFLEEIPLVFDGGGVLPIALARGLHVDRSDLGVILNSRPTIGGTRKLVPPDIQIISKCIVPVGTKWFEWDAGSELDVTVTDGLRHITAVGNAGLVNVSQFVGKEVTVQFELRSGGYAQLDVLGFTETAREAAISPQSKLTYMSAGKESVTLSWAPSTDGILGYEVFSSPNLDTPFTDRVNEGIITDTVFTYSRSDATGRLYQVRSIGSSSRSGTAVIKYSVGATCQVP